MLVAGNTKVSDLLCATPPRIPEGAHAMTQLVEPDSWSRFLAVCICAPDVEMITMLTEEELVARDHLRHPRARQHTG